MNQTFFRLTHHDWVECFTKLSRSELGVLFYLRTLNPFGDRRLKINCQAIGEVLDIHRTSVSRALKKLEQVNLIELEITSAQVKLKTSNRDVEPDPSNDANQVIDKVSDKSVHPRTERAPTHGSVHPRTESVHPRTESVHPRTIGIPEPLPNKDPRTPQTLKTYIDFKKTLSESERENFFNFVKEKTKNLEKPINDLEAWLASKNAARQNRWEIYYGNYQEEKLGESAKANKHDQGLASPTLAQRKEAIARFHARLERNTTSDEPEDTNSEEYQQSLDRLNAALNNPSGFGSSLFQKKAEEEAAKRQARLEKIQRETLELFADPERIDKLLEEEKELRRQLDPRYNPEPNPEINPEDLENE